MTNNGIPRWRGCVGLAAGAFVAAAVIGIGAAYADEPTLEDLLLDGATTDLGP
ncbi:hypothetical protein [Mycobacterium sp.]|uniref:hypothetical protein n=1 Tax=Mycobacterium sp. TaxID=1785 RepID=UPI0031D78253